MSNKFDLNVANFSATNLQICVWKKTDQSDTNHSKIILVSECYVFLQQFYKNAIDSFYDNSLWRKKCLLDTHLFLYGKQTGTIQGTFDLICQPFVQQKIAGITTEDGIKMAAPLIHRGPSVNKHTKIADLAEQLEILNDLFMKTDFTNPQSNHRELEKQIAEQRARKEEEKKHKLDWWEKPVEPQFQVNPPQRPHPSQVSWKSKTKL